MWVFLARASFLGLPKNCHFGSLGPLLNYKSLYQRAPYAGILFILATKQVLGSHEADSEEVGPDSLSMVGWEKMVLIMFVMTLHSLTEGIGTLRYC